MTKEIEILNAITDRVLAYRPKAKKKKAGKPQPAKRKSTAKKKG